MNRKYFKSLGYSKFIHYTRDELKKCLNRDIWRIGGNDSLSVIHIPTINFIENRLGKGFKIQIWMERPKNSKARCKFEIADGISTLSIDKNKLLREKLAFLIRKFFENLNLPPDIELAKGSTILATQIELSRIKEFEEDANDNLDKKGIIKIIVFIQFMENNMRIWNKSNAIDFLEIVS